MRNPLRSGVLALLLAVSPAAFAAEPPAAGREPPAPWKHADLGLATVAAPSEKPATSSTTKPVVRATVPGSATIVDGVLQIKGTMDLWGTADGCHFVYRPADGDVELVARVAAMDNPGGVAHAKASVSIRASLEAGAPHVTYAVTATDGAQFLHRDTGDAKTLKVADDAEAKPALLPKATFPIWLKLARAGDVFTAYESADGATWRKTGSVTVKLPPGTLVGVAVSSHKPDVVATGTFDSVGIKERAGNRPAGN